MTTKDRRDLKAEVIWAATRSGAFQRSRIYKDNAATIEKDEFRNSTKFFLRDQLFIKFLHKEITEKELLKVIESFIHIHNGNRVLKDNNLRFGNAQKFINLYLKCLWVCGYIKTPPHFPVDRIILKKLKIDCNWTKMNKNKYLEIIAAAKKNLKQNSKYKSLAEWEACEYKNNLSKTSAI